MWEVDFKLAFPQRSKLWNLSMMIFVVCRIVHCPPTAHELGMYLKAMPCTKMHWLYVLHRTTSDLCCVYVVCRCGVTLTLAAVQARLSEWERALIMACQASFHSRTWVTSMSPTHMNVYRSVVSYPAHQALSVRLCVCLAADICAQILFLLIILTLVAVNSRSNRACCYGCECIFWIKSAVWHGIYRICLSVCLSVCKCHSVCVCV